MIILDTSIWIEFLKQNADYFEKIKDLLENQKVLAVECIFAELLQGARDESERTVIESYWKNLPKSVHENVWIQAGRYSSEHKLLSKGVGIIDTVILLSARLSKARLYTLDKKLLKLLDKEEVFKQVKKT